jgi:hypothetical protein
MKTYVREATAIAALPMAAALTACGEGDGGSADGTDAKGDVAARQQQAPTVRGPTGHAVRPSCSTRSP